MKGNKKKIKLFIIAKHHFEQLCQLSHPEKLNRAAHKYQHLTE